MHAGRRTSSQVELCAGSIGCADAFVRASRLWLVKQALLALAWSTCLAVAAAKLPRTALCAGAGLRILKHDGELCAGAGAGLIVSFSSSLRLSESLSWRSGALRP